MSQGLRVGTSSMPDSASIDGYMSFHKSIKKHAIATSCRRTIRSTCRSNALRKRRGVPSRRVVLCP